jgi:hypothetical protein
MVLNSIGSKKIGIGDFVDLALYNVDKVKY